MIFPCNLQGLVQFDLVFEKFTCADLSQIALEIMWHSDILNTSVSLGAYPQSFKMSEIIPIFKAVDETSTALYDRMKDFIEKHNSSQYGFRQAHSTQNAILVMVETIQTNMDKILFHVQFSFT